MAVRKTLKSAYQIEEKKPQKWGGITRYLIQVIRLCELVFLPWLYNKE